MNMTEAPELLVFMSATPAPELCFLMVQTPALASVLNILIVLVCLKLDGQ